MPPQLPPQLRQHWVLQSLNRLCHRILPDFFYLPLARLAIAALDAKRRGSSTRIQRDGTLYVARTPRGRYHFHSTFSIGRYLYRHPHDHIEEQLLRKYSGPGVGITEGDIVVDTGANVGEFTRAVAAKASRVISVEPDPAPFACLTRNVGHLPNVLPLCVAIGDSEGELQMYLSSLYNDSSLIEPLLRWTSRIPVTVLTLPSLMQRTGILHIDFLKIETEGFEPEVLAGAGESLRKVRKVAIDVSPERRGVSTAAACRAILAEAGFHTEQRGWVLFALNPHTEGFRPSVSS